MPDFSDFSLWLNAAVFVAAGALVWFAGTRLARYAGIISERTGIRQALLGFLLLGAATSLPEIATSLTASIGGDARLGVNNLLGGIAMQVAVLAAVDAAIGRDALSSVIARPIVLLQGSISAFLLVMVAAAITLGDVAVFGVGLWSLATFAGYIMAVRLMRAQEGRTTWVAPGRARAEPDAKSDSASLSTAKLSAYTAAAALGILIAGFIVTRTGEAMADQTGLGTSFIGAIFIATTTSMPELSSSIAAARAGRYELAIGDIFGGNMFDTMLIFFVDVFYSGDAVLNLVDRFSVIGALLGAALTVTFVVGLIERRDRTILRMGYDSFAILLMYIGGVVALYTLR